MRRLPFAIAAALALSGSVRPAGAEEPGEVVLRLRVPAGRLVRVSADAVARLAPHLAGKPLGVTGPDGTVALVRRADAPSSAVAFVTGPDRGVDDRRARTYTVAEVAADDDEAGRARFGAGDAPSPGTEVFVRADDRVFGSVAAASASVYDRDLPLWWLVAIPPREHVEVPLPLPPGGAAGTLEEVVVRFAQTHEGATTLAARWGATDLGAATVTLSKGLAEARFRAPEGTPLGEGRLRIEDRTAALPEPAPQDASDDRGTVWVDSVAVSVRSPSPVPLVDGRRRVAEVDGDALLRAHRLPPDPAEAARGAEMVIVATEANLPGARRLAQHRTATGVRAVVVPAAHVWDRYGGGDGSPQALRAFLTRLPALRFVLLCGDATHDRTDLVPDAETIPTAFVRTKYNGATASDRALVLPDPRNPVGGPAIGRLPYRDPKDLDAYVDRVVRYETAPPADPTRRLLRFVTSEGRFGPLVDAAIESLFGQVVASLPAPYDVEVTFANPRSAYSWPPEEFNERVVLGLEEGALFHTYVGHGFAHGFDHLWAGGRRHPIFMSTDAARVEVRGTPPAMFVIACTTAIFDDPGLEGVGETLMRRPRGPVSYWGATRICHPAWNSMVGREIAVRALAAGEARLGAIVNAAEDAAILPPPKPDFQRAAILAGMRLLAPGEDVDRLFREGAWMYAMLGDPAIRMAFPTDDLRVAAEASTETLAVVVGDGLEEGAEVHVSLEAPRNALVARPEPAGEGIGPAHAAAMKRNHARANDKALARAVVRAAGGNATAELRLPEGWRERPLAVKAWTVSKGAVRQGAAEVRLPAAATPAGGEPPTPPR